MTLRVAAATSMGNLSVTAAVLNATSATLPLPPHTMGYACTAVRSRATPCPHLNIFLAAVARAPETSICVYEYCF